MDGGDPIALAPPRHARGGDGIVGGEAAPAILVVDDDPDVARELTDAFAAHGLVVATAHSVAEAEAVLAATPAIGVVVADLRMPGEGGLALARTLLSSSTAARGPEVILTTAQATVEDLEAALRLGVADFLRKPFRVGRALEAVNAAHARAARRRISGAEPSAQSSADVARPQGCASLRADPRQCGDAARTRCGAAAGEESATREVGTISHALRTPLNAIAGGLVLLESSATLPDRKRYMDILRDGLAHATEAVELLEEFCRLGQAHEGASAPQDLDALIRSAAAGIMPEASSKGVELVCRIASGQPPVQIAKQIGRLLDLCAAVALRLAESGWVLSFQRDAAAASGSPIVLTVMVQPAHSQLSPPAEPIFAEDTGWMSRPQETLAFTVARRIARCHEGRLTGWNAPDGSLALRLALPA